MIPTLRLAAALVLFSSPAFADPVFVEWKATSGPLPPPYAWSVEMTISAQGALALRHCSGGASAGDGCVSRSAQVGAPQLEAIRAAVVQSGLQSRPMRLLDPPPVGGETVEAVVHMPEGSVTLSGLPVEADADRVGLVLRAIYLAVPAEIAAEHLPGD